MSTALYPLNELCQHWLARVRHAQEAKWKQFGKYAHEAEQFYDGPHDWMWNPTASNGPEGFLRANTPESMKPTFRMSVNKPHEAVALFGPSLFAKYPQVLVEPRRRAEVSPGALGFDLNDPQMAMAFQQLQAETGMDLELRAACAGVKKDYLNAVQLAANKKLHSQRAITDAVVKGMGVLWTDVYRPTRYGDPQIAFPRSTYVPIDHLFLDPDAVVFEDVQVVWRWNALPVNVVERKFGLPPGTLRGHLRSSEASAWAQTAARPEWAPKRPHESSGKDIFEFYEVYSKNGMGHRAAEMMGKELPFDLEELGDYCYLAVADGVPFPLNLPSVNGADMEYVAQQTRWPIPFYLDPEANGGWPFSTLSFYCSTKSVWPISIMKPAIPWIRFINWAVSFLADRVAASAGDLLAASKSFLKGVEDQLGGGQTPFRVLAIEDSVLQKRKVAELLQFIQAPSVNADAFKVIDWAMREVERATGVNELLAGLGGATQIRSAEEASIRNANTQVRPDDMAEKTEEFLTCTVVKEARAALTLIAPQDIEKQLGRQAAIIWEVLQSQPPDGLIRDFQYTIEAGSARKPNIAQRLRGLQEFGQSAMPMIMQEAARGNYGPWNTYATQTADALNIPPDGYVIQPPPPEAKGPSEEEIRASAAEREVMLNEQERQMELAAKEQGIELDSRGRQMELAFDAAEHQQSLQQQKELGAVKVMQARRSAMQSRKNATNGRMKS